MVRSSWFLLPVVILVLAALVLGGCAGPHFEQRSQVLKITTIPPGATIWREERDGSREKLGVSPLRLQRLQDVQVNPAGPWPWLGLGAGVVCTGLGTWVTVEGALPGHSQSNLIYGIPIALLGGFAIVRAGMYIAEGGGSFPESLVLIATLDGYQEGEAVVEELETESEVDIRLKKAGEVSKPEESGEEEDSQGQ